MPAPLSVTWAVATIEAAHQAALDDIDAGTGAGKVLLFTDADVLLCEITLTDPAGTIDSGSGDLTLTPDGTSSAVASGECTYGEITDSDNNLVVALPAQAGTSSAPGKLVINSVDVVSGATLTLVSCVISV
jgi:hypothetical protein